MSVTTYNEVPTQLRQVITVDAHTLRADVSKASGGDGSAPDPHDYFDTSLATCKAITLSMYARSHGIPLERVTVHVERDNSQERQGTYVLNAKLTFQGKLSAEQEQKLAEIADRCPIHKLMTTATVEVRTTYRPAT
jgi:putative redox protein